MPLIYARFMVVSSLLYNLGCFLFQYSTFVPRVQSGAQKGQAKVLPLPALLLLDAAETVPPRPYRQKPIRRLLDACAIALLHFIKALTSSITLIK
jgi:hypothetical protein